MQGPTELPLLELADVSRHFGGLRAVSRVSFGVEAKRVTSLIGPNGAGKTTIFNLISGLLPPTGGSIRYQGAPLDGLPPQARARAGIGRAFQDPRVFQRLSVLDNARLGFPGQTGERLWRGLFRYHRVRMEDELLGEAAEAMLGRVGLARCARLPAGDLSFGQQRFLSLARTLAMRPKLLLLDEPTVGLTLEEVGALARLLRELAGGGQTVLLIEHNMDLVMEISDRVILLVEGQIVAAGSPAEMKRHPKLAEAYLGAGHAP